MQPAEQPDEKDDRKGNSDQPEQKTATHSVSSAGVCSTNVGCEAKFQDSDGSCLGRRRHAPPDAVKGVTARQTIEGEAAALGTYWLGFAF